MKSNPCCIVVALATPNFNVAFGLRVWGRWTKNQTLTQRKLYKALCNIEIWGLGVYLVGVCRVWSFCPSTVSWVYFLLKKVFCWSRWCIRFQHCKEPWPQRTMNAKHNDCKEQWLQRGMTAKKDDCKKTMTAIKQWLQRAVPCKEQFWKEVLHESFVFTCFHIFNLQILKEVSHESFHGTTSTCKFWRKLARMLRFHIFNSQILKDARAKAFLCTTSACRFWKGSLARRLRFHQLAARSGGQNAPHHRPEPCQPIVAQIPVFSYYLIPNSISFSITYITYSYYLIPITCVFAVKAGLLSPCVQKHRDKKIIFSSLANALAPFTWENTGNRN